MWINTGLIVFVVYAPTSDYDDEELEVFFMDLENFYRENHGFFRVIIVDFNAKIGLRRTSEERHIGGTSTITVQTCSIVRNFVYNPIATQSFVDALERFCIAFFNYEMSTITVLSLYTAFPMICVGIAVYNTFISTTFLRTDEFCAMVRRTKWTNFSLVLTQWASAALAFLVYIAIWRRVKRKTMSIRMLPAFSVTYEAVELVKSYSVLFYFKNGSKAPEPQLHSVITTDENGLERRSIEEYLTRYDGEDTRTTVEHRLGSSALMETKTSENYPNMQFYQAVLA
ncbi:unnamed protein product [Angiostrongylus costaricensis]|uniref:G_PROTEIN_RECEP_F1_2 domain-containing protein n=1 Tax=Angiostrongylus costaricensis TaxID=334426 RepID=A0A0R3PKR7_ANGCS|nr:unnamed protein product [Angiostrongylus costaricensis]